MALCRCNRRCGRHLDSFAHQEKVEGPNSVVHLVLKNGWTGPETMAGSCTKGIAHKAHRADNQKKAK